LRRPSDAPLLAISSGEPAGIGPDICCRLAAEAFPARVVVLGDVRVLRARAASLSLPLEIETVARAADTPRHAANRMHVLDIRAPHDVVPGHLDSGNARHVLEILERGTDLCLSRDAAALVTAPVQKSVINEAGIAFSGHTEFLAQRTGTADVVMMLASPTLRVALVTTHLPLRAVAAAVTGERLERTIRIVDGELRALFDLPRPRVLVLGLNPHAGERGVLGDEELVTIVPVLERLRGEGFDLIGPVPADTAFTADSLARADLVLAMYHDQGLPPLKASGFGEIVNVTLGLPIVRTSVDHGTALDLAGTPHARHESLRAAAHLAIEIAGSRRSAP
jgi:4-hydroxythreonine-4-phosphate dehydrogenase